MLSIYLFYVALFAMKCDILLFFNLNYEIFRMKKTILHSLYFTGILMFLATAGQAQSCIYSATADLVETSSDGTTCDFILDLCVSVPNSPSPKRIEYTISYDSNGDGTVDATQTFVYDPPGGSTTIPEGTYCLSGFPGDESFEIKDVPCDTEFEVSIIGYTNAAGGGGGDCSSIVGTVSLDNNLLPVELLAFDGQLKESSVQLNWSVASQINNQLFEVRRSTDGLEFDIIGVVEGDGDLIEYKEFTFVDENPAAGINYYQLRQVDWDGTHEFSDVIQVENRNVNEVMTVYPNPTQGHIYIDYIDGFKEGDEVIVYNPLGQLVYSANGIQGRRIEMNLSFLKEGTYYMKFVKGNKTYINKLLLF